MRRKHGLAAFALALAVTVMAGGAGVADARTRGRDERTRDLVRQEQRIRRGQSFLRRVLQDERASPEIKRQASELQALLAARERILAQLESRHKEFLAQHKADLDELEGLRRRALEIDQRLRSAREAVLQSSEADVAELKQGSTRAEQLIESLRADYEHQRRERRRQPKPE